MRTLRRFPRIARGCKGISMVRRARQSRFVAWLAVAAVWLTVVAPVISRTLPDLMPMPDMAMPSMAMPSMQTDSTATGAVMAMDHDGGMTHGMATMPVSGHGEPAGDPLADMDKCGYCSLFSHTPLAAGDVPPLLLRPLPPPVAPVAARAQRAANHPLAQVRSRGPPSPSLA